MVIAEIKWISDGVEDPPIRTRVTSGVIKCQPLLSGLKAEPIRGGGLHKGAVTQRSDDRWVFKGLGIAKLYCSIYWFGDTFVQR